MSVLVIDDDESIRETIKFMLDLKGYQVFTAANGQAGIELLATIPRPGLILLDLMMPVMSGREFIEAIEKDPKFATIPVVVLTAVSDSKEPIRAIDVVKKPMDLEALFKAVKRWHDG